MKKSIARLLLCAFCLLVGAGLGGCAAPPAPEKESMRIGLCVYDGYDTFIKEVSRYFTAAARWHEEEEGITVTIQKEEADGSQTTQNSQVEEFIAAGCDVICVNLVDRTDASMIIDMAEAAGTPVIFFNRELVEEDLYRSDLLYYVGADASESGRMQGEIVVDLWRTDKSRLDRNGDGVVQYVMLEGEKDHQDAIVRTDTAIKEVMGAGIRLERLEDEIANWVRAEAEGKMRGWLQTHGGRIELVFSNNDDMALGAADALQAAEVPLDERPVVVGIDGTPVGLNGVLAGLMAGTVYNDAKGQAESMMELACALYLGTPPPALTNGKYIRLPYQIVTAGNVSRYLSRVG